MLVMIHKKYERNSLKQKMTKIFVIRKSRNKKYKEHMIDT